MTLKSLCYLNGRDEEDIRLSLGIGTFQGPLEAYHEFMKLKFASSSALVPGKQYAGKSRKVFLIPESRRDHLPGAI